MEPEPRVVAITGADACAEAGKWLILAEPVHRQLRPQLPGDYVSRMSEIFRSGVNMALVVDSDSVICVALWRVIENTYEGRRLYVDDLVSAENRRSGGAGKMMLGWLEMKAVELGCQVLALDSGVQRQRAHRFYFREGMHISSFCFRKNLQ